MRYALPLTALVATASSVAQSEGIPGYGIEQLEWEFEAVEGGPKQVVNGTIEDVYREILSINPEYKLKKRSLSSEKLKRIEAREDFSSAGWICGIFGWGFQNAIADGVSYLRGLSGQPTNGPGPGNCGRVSCSSDSAIWWCNDTPADKTLESWDSIADGAVALLDRCSQEVFSDSQINPDYVAGGQIFHASGWNVIVRDATC